MKCNKKSGFTLIELMAVVAIIAILAAVMVPNISGYINRSKKTVVINQVRGAFNAIETYNTTSTNIIEDNIEISNLVKENGILVTQGLLEEKDIDKISKLKVHAVKKINGDKDALNKITIDNNGEIIYDNIEMQ